MDKISLFRPCYEIFFVSLQKIKIFKDLSKEKYKVKKGKQSGSTDPTNKQFLV